MTRSRVVLLTALVSGEVCMAVETITAAQLGFHPAEKPAGTLLIDTSDEIRRVGEGSFILRSDGAIQLFYDCRRTPGDLDKSFIRSRCSRDGGNAWTDERTVLEDKDDSILQPSLCRMTNGCMGMTFSRISMASTRQAAKFFVSSTNEGVSWSTPVPVSDGICSYMTGAHDRLICLSNGRLVSLVHGKLRIAHPEHLGSFVYTSDDCGRTWVNRTPKCLDVDAYPFPKTNNAYGLWETSVVELDNGALLLYGRTGSGWVYESRSSDSGATWSAPAQTGIPNPLAPMRLARIPGTSILLMVRNPLVNMPSGWHGGARRALAIQASADNGRTWSRPMQIEFTTTEDQWFDYPFLLWVGDTLHLGYRSPMEKSFECTVYYQRLGKSELMNLVEPTAPKPSP